MSGRSLIGCHNGICQVLLRDWFWRKRIRHVRRMESKYIPSRCWMRRGWNRWWTTEGSRWRRAGVRRNRSRGAIRLRNRAGGISRRTGMRWCLVVSRRSHRWDNGSRCSRGRCGCRIRRGGRRCERISVSCWSTVVAGHGSRVGCGDGGSGKSQQIGLCVTGGVRSGLCALTEVMSAFVDRGFNGPAEIRFLLLLGRGHVRFKVCARIRGICGSVGSSIGTRHALAHGTLDTELKDLWHQKERLAVDRHVVLAKAWLGGHWRSGVTEDFDDVISFALPAKVQEARPVGGIMDLSSVHHNLALSRGKRPHNGHVVLFTTTVGSVSTVFQRLWVGVSKTPSHFPLGRGNTLSCCDCRKVDLVRDK
mmetsp:Transcript_14807/g.30653  ORF Transcript_14807/g.30653 Transcript_14807/m.30653 type:complete len:363 (-) Transcript_14807:231-1319(-)